MYLMKTIWYTHFYAGLIGHLNYIWLKCFQLGPTIRQMLRGQVSKWASNWVEHLWRVLMEITWSNTRYIVNNNDKERYINIICTYYWKDWSVRLTAITEEPEHSEEITVDIYRYDRSVYPPTQCARINSAYIRPTARGIKGKRDKGAVFWLLHWRQS